jgi:hypothetical protein
MGEHFVSDANKRRRPVFVGSLRFQLAAFEEEGMVDAGFLHQLFPMQASEGGRFSLAIFDPIGRLRGKMRRRCWFPITRASERKQPKAAIFRWSSSTQLAAFEEERLVEF